MKDLVINRRMITRNTIMNFIGQAIPALVGLIIIPFVIKGLGTDRFGIFCLAWIILGYIAIFDFGFGRSTTKFVAEALGSGKTELVPNIVCTSVVTQGILGTIGALVLFSITPLLVQRIMSIPTNLAQEAKFAFYVIALVIPVSLISNSFTGALEAAQRFDLVNAVRIPSNILTYLLPLVGILLGLQLPGIFMLILVSRIIILFVLIMLYFGLFAKKGKFVLSLNVITELFSYGRWILISIIIGPILVYIDRFFVGSLVSMAALAYYTVPYEAVTRLWIIPASLSMTLFPAFGALVGTKDQNKMGVLLIRSIQYVLLILGPIILVIVLFAREILQIWVGGEFAARGTVVMQVLAGGVMINSLAHATFALLQGIGRPDITAKMHLLEFVIYIGVAWLLVTRWGVVGASVAWTMRVTADTILLFVAAFKVCHFSPRMLINDGLKATISTLLLLSIFVYFLKFLLGDLSILAMCVILVSIYCLYIIIVWRYVLDSEDRNALIIAVKFCDN